MPPVNVPRRSDPSPSPPQAATFKLRDSKLIIDGSFITETHFVAKSGGGGTDVASFWADKLNEFNTGEPLRNPPRVAGPLSCWWPQP